MSDIPYILIGILKAHKCNKGKEKRMGLDKTMEQKARDRRPHTIVGLVKFPHQGSRALRIFRDASTPYNMELDCNGGGPIAGVCVGIVTKARTHGYCTVVFMEDGGPWTLGRGTIDWLCDPVAEHLVAIERERE